MTHETHVFCIHWPIHLVLPSHPLLVMSHLQDTGTGAVVGHSGFDKIEAGDALMQARFEKKKARLNS